MKKIILVLLALGTFIFTSLTMLGQENNTEELKVVELFTSQGCSSCPSADRLLSQYADKENVIALSFHVSYWNYLGWKDPYSSKSFTERQRMYASEMNLQSIYTPQVIINGQEEFVGSNKARMATSISNENRTLSKHSIQLLKVEKEGNQLQLNYAIDGELTDLNLNIAVVERHVKNYVPRGENRGRTLNHDNVVRFFKTINAKSNDQLTIDLPEFTTSDQLVVLYLQDQDLHVKAGVKKPI